MSVTTEGVSELLRSTRDCAVPEATLHAGAAERDRSLHPTAARAIVEAGFARHLVAGRWGGSAGGFTELLSAAAALAEHCPSAGWCAALQAAHGRLAAHLPEQGQKELWAASPDVPIAAAVSPGGGGTLTRVPDGWLLSGRWHFASAVDHAEWVLLSATDTPAGTPADSPAGTPAQEPRSWIVAVPRADIEIHGRWNGTGLRGSGSHGLGVTESFVPDHRAVPRARVERGLDTPDADRCHRIPAALVATLIFAAPALGAARGALAAWVAAARTRSDATGRPAPGDSGLQQVLARSSAEIDAAGLLLERAARRADRAPLDDLPVALNLRDCAVAVDLLVGAVERLFRSAGASAQVQDGDLQRYWHDIHAVAAHAALQLAPAAAVYADHVLGPR
jgi:alkylation response protein AidB-like acyl-CoA dehydrogenase